MDKEPKIAFLVRHSQIKERIRILMERRKAYEDDIYGIKATIISDIPKGGGRKADISDKVIKLLTMSEDIDNELAELAKKLEYIRSVVGRLTNLKYRSALELKYIDGLQRKQIGGILGVNIQQVDRITRRALAVLPLTDEDIDNVM